MQAKQIKLIKVVIVVVALLTVSLNLTQIKSRENTIYIGTKNLTEQQIIANLYKEVIETNTDYKVRIISGLDTTSFVQSALLSGDIDMYVEYTSTAYLEVFKHVFDHQSSEEIVSALKSDYRNIGLELNSLLGFENSNAIICNQFCDGIDQISDLDGKTFSFAAPAYFFERSDGYNLLTEAYDFSNVEIVKADPVIIYQGIMNGQIDVGLGFTTDAKLAREDIKVLSDDDMIFPSYDAMLVTTGSFKADFPEVVPVLEQISGTISTEEIQNLNDQVENQNMSAAEVAHNFAIEKGYI